MASAGHGSHFLPLVEVFSISCILILTKVTRMTDLYVTLYPYPHSSVVTQYWAVGLVSGGIMPRFVQNNFFITVYKATARQVPFSLLIAKCQAVFPLKVLWRLTGWSVLEYSQLFCEGSFFLICALLWVFPHAFFFAFQTKYLEMVWVVSRHGYWIPRLGVAVTLAYALESYEARLLDRWDKVAR